MKQSVIIIIAVAIIGTLGVAAKGQKNNAASPAPATPSSNSSTLSSSTTGATSTNSGTSSAYKDGTYNGASEDTPYGVVQVAAVISGGKITDVKFLQMPYDMSHSQMVSSFAEPYLKDETIQDQSSNIQFVSGATTTSEAYQLSLQAALDQAAVG